MEDKLLKVRSATIEDTSLIFSFIRKKAEFDRRIGAFSGVLRVSPEKIRNTLFSAIPFAYVLFSEIADREIGFALYGFRSSRHRMVTNGEFDKFRTGNMGESLVGQLICVVRPAS